MPVLESAERPLTAAERRLLERRIRDLGRRAGRVGPALAVGSSVIVVLWLLTLLASDAPWTVVTIFWIVAGGLIVLWVRRDLTRDAAALVAMRQQCESARRHDLARTYEVRARAFVEFEEVEDEGACYAFELPGPRVVFVTGQQYYPEARFPSLDFTMVEMLDESGRPAGEHLDKRGARARPERIIPASRKLELRPPEHREVLSGSLDDVERLLAHNRPSM